MGSLHIISGYSHIISSKEEAIGALDELHGRLSRANHKDFRLKKKYNKAVSKLQLFGNQTCNGHWLSNDFELSLASIKNQRHNARTIEWSFDVLRRPWRVMQSYLCIHLIDYTLLEGLADLRYMYVAKNSSFLIFCISNRGSSGGGQNRCLLWSRVWSRVWHRISIDCNHSQ